MKVDLIYGGFGQDGIITSQILAANRAPHIRIGRTHHRCHLVENRQCLLGRNCSDFSLASFSLSDFLDQNDVRDCYFYAAHHASAENRSAGVADAIESFRVNYHLFSKILGLLAQKSSARSVFYASSSKIFEKSDEVILTETVPSAPETAYAESKSMVRELIDSLKVQLPFKIYNGILFNHESIYRKPDFFTPKVISQAIEVLEGARDFIELKSINGEIDMSLSSDFCKSIVDLTQSAAPSGDYILASGRAISLKKFIQLVFRSLGIPGFPVVEIQKTPLEGSNKVIIGDISKISRTVNFRIRSAEELVSTLVHQYRSRCDLR
ncbi:NAD-dependent epimerase/dehydratase [Gammaproteobacteria bacterium]|nr:NAD-dependent epimerase/dehydratase [Gammaproteobacteria bacterium]